MLMVLEAIPDARALWARLAGRKSGVHLLLETGRTSLWERAFDARLDIFVLLVDTATVPVRVSPKQALVLRL